MILWFVYNFLVIWLLNLCCIYFCYLLFFHWLFFIFSVSSILYLRNCGVVFYTVSSYFYCIHLLNYGQNCDVCRSLVVKIRNLRMQLVMICVALLYMGSMHVWMNLHCHVKPYMVKYILIIDYYMNSSGLTEPNVHWCVPKCALCWCIWLRIIMFYENEI